MVVDSGTPSSNGIQNAIASSINFEAMIGQPFVAASNAQVLLCNATIDFLNSFCLDKSGNVLNTTLSVNYDDPSGNMRDANGNLTGQSQKHLTVPLICLLNVPAFQMQKITVDLRIQIDSMTKVDTSANDANSTGMSVGGGVSGNVGGNKDKTTGAKSAFGQLEIHGEMKTSCSGGSSKASSSADSTSIVYNVHMEAENNPPPGLGMIINWLTGSVAQPAPNRSLPATQTGGPGYPIPKLT